MRLRFLVIDPDTDGEDCPALHLDEETGDLAVIGETITDPSDLAAIKASTGLKSCETAIIIPARMRKHILEALRELDDSSTLP
ncbi:hypothetical protein [Nonomuraea endophytica]|uniref:hypothetical protein n=1 Tax=Nonomuraea endophytica TaxID=714136 RepID=UPI0037CC00F9